MPPDPTPFEQTILDRLDAIEESLKAPIRAYWTMVGVWQVARVGFAGVGVVIVGWLVAQA